ncbi:MAG TPA: hypothetical protein PKX40_21695 [Spirochaetota bacterium]|nr:hypothetical protein [Spirochaetota bacterium]
MKRLLILGAAAIALLSPGCSRNIDGLVRQHGCEAAYYYHSGGTQTDRFTTITVVMNKNGGILKREEHSVSSARRNKETLARFTVSDTDLQKLCEMIKQRGFFDLKTVQKDEPDARTLYLKIKAGAAHYIREESPVVSMAATADRVKFMDIIGGFNAFVKDRLPAEKKHLLDY